MVYYKGTTCRLVLHGKDLRRAQGPVAEDEAAALVYCLGTAYRLALHGEDEKRNAFEHTRGGRKGISASGGPTVA